MESELSVTAVQAGVDLASSSQVKIVDGLQKAPHLTK